MAAQISGQYSSNGGWWISAAGLNRASLQMDQAAQTIVSAGLTSVPDSTATTGGLVVDGNAGILGDGMLSGLVDLMSAKQAFAANAVALREQADTSRSLIDMLG